MFKKSMLPVLFTFGNLSCGILSLIITFNKNYKVAAILILIAALLDRYDGRIARFFNVSSQIGKQLDSLADLVSFGVAPSILIFNMYNLIKLGFISYLLVLIFPLSGAYRLARYNVTKFDGNFTGVPITITGSLLALYVILNPEINILFPIFLLILLSYLMISNLKFKKM